MSISEVLDLLEKDHHISGNIVTLKVEEARTGEFSDLPEAISPDMRNYLIGKGFQQLYRHQAEAVNAVFRNRNVVISTGVASGKSLCYQIPILQKFLENRGSRYLLLYPTKALAQDQKKKLSSMTVDRIFQEKQPLIGIYDGDTPNEQRKLIREKANIIFTNPDMLHLGILPHHTNWAVFFRNLKFIVIDEVHVYRGIFGSHFGNVLRRLKRICKFYQADPQFIITSATLANADKFIKLLTERDFVLIDQDDSPHRKRIFLIYNPPVIDKNLGIRKSALQETVFLTQKLMPALDQILIFAHTRRQVELILTYLQEKSNDPEIFKGYRSGYLPEERREIEQQLRSGEIRAVVATNALELGIDIGGLDCVVINGYPGSIAAVRQQAGRAGRKGTDSLAVLVANSSLIDQYLTRHPEFLFDNSPEEALINPDNPFILLHHLRCAIFEKPFLNTENFGSLPPEAVSRYLDLLRQYDQLYESEGTFFWKSGSYPAEQISLRVAGAGVYVLKENGNSIGTVDEASAFWMAHPQAVYLHGGCSYLVTNLDLQTKEITLEAKETEYYTQSQSKTDFELIDIIRTSAGKGGRKFYGNLKVSDQVSGFKKIKWFTNEFLGYGECQLPATEMITSGCWFALNPDTIRNLEDQGAWDARNDYGTEWNEITRMIRKRDQYTCCSCGAEEQDTAFDVHHIIPLRTYTDRKQAHRPENLVTLCPACHRAAEKKLYIQSTLAGFRYLLINIAPLFLMCDQSDIRAHTEVFSRLADGMPALIFHDSVPGGIGLSEKIYEIFPDLLREGQKVVSDCSCTDGCPACVGPVAENGLGAREKVQILLAFLNDKNEE